MQVVRWALCVTVLFIGTGFVGGCSWLWQKPQPHLELTVKASPMINPRLDIDSSPVFLRVYQLTDYFRFQQANFLDLYQNNVDAALSSQLVYQEAPVPLLPGETLKMDITLQPQSRYLGILAQFNRYDESAHRLWIPLFEGVGKKRKVTVVVSGLNVSLQN